MKAARLWLATVLLVSGTALGAEHWVVCAPEGGACRFDGNRRVAYGVGTKWMYRNLEGSVQCNAAAFGGDPAPGKAKRCRFLAAPALINAIPNYTRCAQEGEVCRFNGTRKVAFGAGSKWVQDSFVNGISCTNGVFGDPAPGVKKECRIGGPR